MSLYKGLLWKLHSHSKDNLTPVTNGATRNAYKPTATRLFWVVPSGDLNSLFLLTKNYAGDL